MGEGPLSVRASRRIATSSSTRQPSLFASWEAMRRWVVHLPLDDCRERFLARSSSFAAFAVNPASDGLADDS
jgi:hypothetical protein